MTALLRVEDLSKAYGHEPVFQSVSFTLQAGEHCAILGPSGCGKSTLLRLLAGLDAPAQGGIWLDNQLVSEAGHVRIPPHERRISMVFQDLALWPTLTALANVILGMAGLDLPRAQRRTQALDALKACRIETLAERSPAALSAGQQQRVALARALAVKPALLLLDEPFSGLDLVLKTELFDEIRSLAARFNTTLGLVTHDPLEAEALCLQAIVMEEGGLREEGRLRDLLVNPSSETLGAFKRRLSGARQDTSRNGTDSRSFAGRD